MHTRRDAFILLILAGAWIVLTCVASLHHCPEDEGGAHRGKCEFYGHSLHVQARVDVSLSSSCVVWKAAPIAMVAAVENATPANPFDRSSTCERAPPA